MQNKRERGLFYMRRNHTPFNGKQFILNKNTGEIHDLDRETPDCHIDEINPEHIFSCDTYTEAVLFASMLAVTRNGYPHCMPERNRH